MILSILSFSGGARLTIRAIRRPPRHQWHLLCDDAHRPQWHPPVVWLPLEHKVGRNMKKLEDESKIIYTVYTIYTSSVRQWEKLLNPNNTCQRSAHHMPSGCPSVACKELKSKRCRNRFSWKRSELITPKPHQKRAPLRSASGWCLNQSHLRGNKVTRFLIGASQCVLINTSCIICIKLRHYTTIQNTSESNFMDP